MKKAITVILLCGILSAAIAGCGITYKRPWDHFCFKADGKIEVVLSESDADYIIDILNNGNWINDLGNCGCDFVFYFEKQEVRYHSECGTFNDYTNKRSLTVTKEQRQTINILLRQPKH